MLIIFLVPTEVRHLKAIPPNSTAMNISWIKPSLPNGLLQEYWVTYNHSADNHTTIKVDPSKTEVVISDLKKWTFYVFSVLAKNIKYEGERRNATERTQEDSKIFVLILKKRVWHHRSMI